MLPSYIPSDIVPDGLPRAAVRCTRPPSRPDVGQNFTKSPRPGHPRGRTRGNPGVLVGCEGRVPAPHRRPAAPQGGPGRSYDRPRRRRQSRGTGIHMSVLPHADRPLHRAGSNFDTGPLLLAAAAPSDGSPTNRTLRRTQDHDHTPPRSLESRAKRMNSSTEDKSHRVRGTVWPNSGTSTGVGQRGRKSNEF